MSLFLSVTFSCGLVIAFSHVLNRQFIAPVYDVVLNLAAFASATAASAILEHWVPAGLSIFAIACWLVLARRTYLARQRLRAELRPEPVPAAQSRGGA